MTTETRQTEPAAWRTAAPADGTLSATTPDSPSTGVMRRGQTTSGLSASAADSPPRTTPPPAADNHSRTNRSPRTTPQAADNPPRTDNPRPGGQPSADSHTDKNRAADKTPWWRPNRRPEPPKPPTDKIADKAADTAPGWAERRRLKRQATRDDITDVRARRALIAEQTGGSSGMGGWWIAMWSFGTTTLISALAALVFSMGNVSSTAMAAGIPWLISMAISPTVDVVVIGLTVVVQFMVLAGASPQYVRSAKRMLIFSAAAMLLINSAPSVIGAMTTDYAGPLMHATRDYTPAVDQLTATQLWWKAAIEAIVPGILVLWSHVGPKIAEGLGEIRHRTNLAALAKVEVRTLATEQDRAAADAARAAAAAELADAREQATALRRMAELEVEQLRAAAAKQAAQLRQDADSQAEALRRELSANLSADRDTAAREMAKARQMMLEAQALVDNARADRDAAQRTAERLVEEARRTAEQTTVRAGHEVEMLNSRAATELAQARQLAAQAAADKAAAEEKLRLSADNLRAAEQLLAEATADSTPVHGQRGGQAGGQPAVRRAVPAQPPAAGRLSAEELLDRRVALVKQAREDWAVKIPTQGEIAEIIGVTGGSATSPVRKRLAEEASALSSQPAEQPA